jgi:copper/silver efflux system protein
MTVCVVLASFIPILWETGVGSDVTKPIAAPIVGGMGMITSTIHVLILVPVFFVLMKERDYAEGHCNRENRQPLHIAFLDTAKRSMRAERSSTA